MIGGRRTRLAAGLLALSSGLLAGSCRDSDPTAPAGPAAAELLRDEPRVRDLLVPCADSGFYDRDLSDLALVLTDKLERARPDALKRAKEELGLLGEGAHPSLGRFFQRNYGDLMRTPLLENAVDAMAFNRTEASHELLIEAAQHPQESVRRKAYEALGQHQRPGDFDFLVARLELEQGDTQRQVVPVLYRVDRARAEALFLDWIERAEHRPLVALTTPLLAATRLAESGQRCARLFEGLEPPACTHLAAAAARTGDAAALRFLSAELRHEAGQRRLAAVHAAGLAGLTERLEYSALEDPEATNRALAVAALGDQAELVDAQRAWLHTALNDASPIVQGEALQALCAHGDPLGLAQALTLLHGEGGPLTQALQALREPMRADQELARSVLEVLLERNELEEDRPLLKRTSTLKAIGLVPLPEAAELLHRMGVAAEGQQLEGLRAHDWLMIQAGNTGRAGRERLNEILQQESDPLRRLDLIDVVASARDELTRSALLPLVEDESREPLERLFTASALVRCGPSWEIAPRLKRVVYAMQRPEEREARRALQCLLWFWY